MWYWELRRNAPSVSMATSGWTVRRLFAGRVLPHREHRGVVRRVGHQVTMDNGGGALQGTGVCVARAPYGARLPPLPAGESRDLPAAFASLRSWIAFATTPGAAPVRPGRRPHPPASSHHRPSLDIWLCTESGLGLSRPEIRSSTKDTCRASAIPSRACPDTSSLMSSTQLRRACLPVRVVCAAARREARQSELPRDFCPTLPPWRAFCSPVWFGELRRFTKSEANITTILTANLPFMFTHRGFPLSILVRPAIGGLGEAKQQSRN